MKYLAQSVPRNGQTIQRTIEVEDEIQTAPAQADSKATGTVLFGLGAVLLLLIAVGAAMLLWKNYPINKEIKSSKKD